MIRNIDVRLNRYIEDMNSRKELFTKKAKSVENIPPTKDAFIQTLKGQCYKTFGLSMVTDTTQLVFVDEMNSDLLPPDQAKIFLQGGMVTVSRKHVNAHIVQNNAGECILSVHFHSVSAFCFL